MLPIHHCFNLLMKPALLFLGTTTRQRLTPKAPSVSAWPKHEMTTTCGVRITGKGSPLGASPLPVTDGTYVYTTTVNNAIAAVDLKDGSIAWLKWDKPEGNTHGPHTRFVASPLLVGDYLIVNQNDEIRAFNKKTGEKNLEPCCSLLQAEKGQKTSRQYRNPWNTPHPEASSPCHLKVPLADGGSMDVIADGGAHAYRLEDGVIVSTEMPWLRKGASPIAVDNTYCWANGADRGVKNSGGIVRVTAKSRDQLELTEVFLCDDKAMDMKMQQELPGVIYQGQWIGNFRSGVIGVSLADGERKSMRKIVS